MSEKQLQKPVAQLADEELRKAIGRIAMALEDDGFAREALVLDEAQARLRRYAKRNRSRLRQALKGGNRGE